MGKAKKRNFHNCIKTVGKLNKLPTEISRNEALSFIVQNINNNTDIEETKYYISLFGITAEELAESGASYESILALKHLFL